MTNKLTTNTKNICANDVPMSKPSKRGKKTKREKKISYRQLAAIQMKQLSRIGIYLTEECGEILDVDVWLEVLANILSSFPPGNEWIGRDNTKIVFGLSEASLAKACVDCRISASKMQISRQVRETLAWRLKMSQRHGRLFSKPMKLDTIGKRLGVTEEVRQLTQAWNIGTYDGSPKQRAQAGRMRDKFRQRQKREAAGATPRSKSLTALKPWEAYGVCRRTWERWRLAGYLPDAGCDDYTQAHDAANSSVVNSSEAINGLSQIHPGPSLVHEREPTLRASPSRQTATDQRLGGQLSASESGVLTERAKALRQGILRISEASGGAMLHARVQSTEPVNRIKVSDDFEGWDFLPLPDGENRKFSPTAEADELW